MSDAQLLRFFETYKNQVVCGRFESAQLQRPLVALQPTRKPWRLAVALLAGLGLGTTGYAQSAPPMVGRVAVHQPASPLPTSDHSRVIDADNGRPVVGAVVAAYAATGEFLGGTTTNAKGDFRLGDLPAEGSTIEVRYMGYRTQQFIRPTTSTLTVRLAPDEHRVAVLGKGVEKRKHITSTGVIAISHTKQRPWWKRLFPRRKRIERGAKFTEATNQPPLPPLTEAPETGTTTSFTVSPNPARTEVQLTLPENLVYPVRLRWIGVDGRVLRSEPLMNKGKTRIQLPETGSALRPLLLSVENAEGRVLTEQVIQTN